MSRIAVLSARRTPMAAFQGQLASVPAPKLAATAIAAAVADAGVDPSTLTEANIGLVLQAGVGQAPARQAVLTAGLSEAVTATTISKVCGSGMKAIIDTAVRIRAGEADLAIAGGMESMSNAPHLLPTSRTGKRLGHGRIVDHMFHDGLEDAYETGTLMGEFAQRCADDYQFTREMQDAYAIGSLDRALAAQARNAFDAEIAPVTVSDRKGEHVVDTDEAPLVARPDKIPHLKPAFRPDGTITAASSSSISDGAAALVLASEDEAARLGRRPLGWIVGTAAHAQAPSQFATAPVAATRKLLDRLGWQAADVDLWEVNEAFAMVAMAFIHDLGLERDRVNVNGGACALGHPIGASGARIVVTLLHALQERGLNRGIASICIGGGEALSIAVERD